MTKINDIYKCEICGNIVEVTHAGGGELVCCGAPMVLKKPNYEEDVATEKHIPVIEKTDNGIVVKVGEVEHPMENEHYIEWIEATLTSGETFRKMLKPGEKPEMTLCSCGEEKCSCDVIAAREYCNQHGLWANSIKN